VKEREGKREGEKEKERKVTMNKILKNKVTSGNKTIQLFQNKTIKGIKLMENSIKM